MKSRLFQFTYITANQNHKFFSGLYRSRFFAFPLSQLLVTGCRLAGCCSLLGASQQTACKCKQLQEPRSQPWSGGRDWWLNGIVPIVSVRPQTDVMFEQSAFSNLGEGTLLLFLHT
jgi:hypothetical protein